MTEETSSFNPREIQGSTVRPQMILDKYIRDLPSLQRLIAPQKISNPVVAEAAQEIEALNWEDTDELNKSIFSVIGTEKPLGEADPQEQDYREGALELLRLVNFRRANKGYLLAAYLSQVQQTPEYAEPYGSIYSLLEAGEIIAPYLPERKSTMRFLIDMWNKVIAASLVNVSIRIRHQTYEDLRGKVNSMIASLPNSSEIPVADQQTQAVTVPAMRKQPKTPKAKLAKPSRKEVAEEDVASKIFKETLHGARTYEITTATFPWLKEKIQLPLDRTILKQSGNAGLYLGVCIARGDPADVAEAMGKDYRRKAFNTFYTVLPGWITQHTSDRVKTLTNQRSIEKIHYTSNPSGQRLYFIEVDRIDNEPVIIIIGMCDKAQQIPLLRAFTTTSIKDLKKLGRI